MTPTLRKSEMQDRDRFKGTPCIHTPTGMAVQWTLRLSALDSERATPLGGAGLDVALPLVMCFASGTHFISSSFINVSIAMGYIYALLDW